MYALICSFEVEQDRFFQHDETGIIVSHIIPIKNTASLVVVPLRDVLSKVFRVDSYVCEELNRFEQVL